MSFKVLSAQLRPFGLWQHSASCKLDEKKSLASSILPRILATVLLCGNLITMIYLGVQSTYTIKSTVFVASSYSEVVKMFAKPCAAVLLVSIAIRGFVVLALHLWKVQTGKHSKLLEQSTEVSSSLLTKTEIQKFQRRLTIFMVVMSAILFLKITYFFTVSALYELEVANKTIADHIQLFPFSSTFCLPFGAYYGILAVFFYLPFYLSVVVNVFVAAFGFTVNAYLKAYTERLQRLDKELLPFEGMPSSKFEERTELKNLTADVEKLVEDRGAIFRLVNKFNRQYGVIMGASHALNFVICSMFVYLLVVGDSVDSDGTHALMSGITLFMFQLTALYMPLAKAGHTALKVGEIVYVTMGKLYRLRIGEAGGQVYGILKDFQTALQLFPLWFSILSANVTAVFASSTPGAMAFGALILLMDSTDENRNRKQCESEAGRNHTLLNTMK